MNRNKPTVLKILEGNPGQRPINKNEPKPTKKIPNCPDWLETEAKAEWRRVVPELSRLGLLTSIDRAALIGYCESWARYVEAEKYLSKQDSVMVTDTGYMQQVPQVGIAQKYLKICQSFMSEFGLTPSARGRMSIGGKELGEDPMERLFKNRNVK